MKGQDIIDSIVQKAEANQLKHQGDEHSIPEWLLIIERQLEKAKRGWYQNGVVPATEGVLNIAACSFEAMRQHCIEEGEEFLSVLYLQGNRGCALYVGEVLADQKPGRFASLHMLELATEHGFSSKNIISASASRGDNEYYELCGKFPGTRSALCGHYDEP